MPEHILFILVKPELLKDKLISLRQLGSRKPNGNAGLHGVILDEVHDGVDGAVNGAAHIVCAAEIDAAGLFLVSRHVDGMAHNLSLIHISWRSTRRSGAGAGNTVSPLCGS